MAKKWFPWLCHVGQQGHAAIEQRLAQANAVTLSVHGKLQKKLPVVAAVSEVVGEARNEIPIGPWHGATMRKPAPE
jgi:hypothetical protein